MGGGKKSLSIHALGVVGFEEGVFVDSLVIYYHRNMIGVILSQ